MVDRYRSFLDDSLGQSKSHNKSSFLIESQVNQYDKYIKNVDRHFQSMRKCITDYRRATNTEQEQEIIERYKNEELGMKKARQYLVGQYRYMENEGKNDPEMLFVKEYLLKLVQKQLKSDVELNEVISQRQMQKQKLKDKLPVGSQRLKNVVADLQEKRKQIMYLDEAVKQCVNLLQVIGILVLEQGDKIKIARQHVEKANENVEQALKKIEVAKIRTQKSNRRKCCIIFLGVAVIIIILVVLGFVKFDW